MTFYQLAYRYLSRKIGKTIILFLVLLFVSSMVLSTIMILGATNDSKKEIQAQAKAKIILEIKERNNLLTQDEVEQIGHLDEVASLNRLASNLALPIDFTLITNSISTELNNQQITLLAYDDLENDSPFFESQYHLTTGDYLQQGVPGVVVNVLLAEVNGFGVGDQITVQSKAGKTVSVPVVGLFIAGHEQKQTVDTMAINRIENQIFIDNVTYSTLFEEHGYRELVIYSKNPETLKTLKTQLDEIMQGKVNITTSDNLYEQMAAPLEQIAQMTELMLILTLITSTVIVALLLCMWMRARQKEVAIFISLGKSKGSIYLQTLLESGLVFIIALLGASIVGHLMANFLQGLLTSSSNMSLHVTLRFSDIVTLLKLGGLTVWIAVTCTMFFIIRTHPKDTLSKMEG